MRKIIYGFFGLAFKAVSVKLFWKLPRTILSAAAFPDPFLLKPPDSGEVAVHASLLSLPICVIVKKG